MRTVVITGGSQGIGQSIATEFLKNNYNVIVNARKPTAFCQELGENGRFVAGDACLRETHQELVKTALEWTGQLDVYINNVGYSWWKPASEIEPEFLDKMMATNFNSTFWGAQVAIKEMKSGGSIINISSLAGKRGSANNSAYCASKFAVNGLTQSLAKEVGGQGIRVNAVCPVYVQTENLLEALKENVSPVGGLDTQTYFQDFAKSQAALKRLPLGEEVAQSCLFLAGENSSAITGQCINVDCGVMPQ